MESGNNEVDLILIGLTLSEGGAARLFSRCIKKCIFKSLKFLKNLKNIYSNSKNKIIKILSDGWLFPSQVYSNHFCVCFHSEQDMIHQNFNQNQIFEQISLTSSRLISELVLTTYGMPRSINYFNQSQYQITSCRFQNWYCKRTRLISSNNFIQI